MSDFIYVKATDPTVCALWEKSSAHPDGEVFVTGENALKVGQTPAVQRAIKNGHLIETDSKGKPKI